MTVSLWTIRRRKRSCWSFCRRSASGGIFEQPESDFPPGLTLRVGEYARVEVFDPSNVIVAYYTVSLIQPPLGTFTNLSTQTRWRLQDNEAVAAVAAYIRELTE